MFCKNCGNEMKDGVKFCGKCGAEQTIQNDLLSKSETQEGTSESSRMNSEGIQSDKETKKESSLLTNILAIIFAIVIIWLMITGVQWLFLALGAPSDKKDGTGIQATDPIDADYLFQ